MNPLVSLFSVMTVRYLLGIVGTDDCEYTRPNRLKNFEWSPKKK